MKLCLRQLVVLSALLTLNACVTPHWESDYDKFHIHAQAFDPNFPDLMAYTESFDPYAVTPKWYRFAHLPPGAPQEPSEFVERSLESIPSHYKPLDEVLFPTFSRAPKVRIVEQYYEYSSGSGANYLHLDAYHGGPGTTRHFIDVTINAQNFYAHTDWKKPVDARYGPNDLPTPVFAVVDGYVIYLFMNSPVNCPNCADLTPAEALGEFSGIPAELTNRRYVVMISDLAPQAAPTAPRYSFAAASLLTPSKAYKAWWIAECWRSYTGAGDYKPPCAPPAQPVKLTEDPRPHITSTDLPPLYACKRYKHRVDWHKSFYVSWTDRGQETVHQWCSNLKR